jgi:hypothetical protein
VKKIERMRRENEKERDIKSLRERQRDRQKEFERQTERV